MNEKKVLLFIVEGVSEEFALKGILASLFCNKLIRFHVVRGDATNFARQGNRSIKTYVNSLVQKFLSAHHFKTTNLLQVIQLMDTDGAFVPNSAIIEKEGLENLYYSETAIYAPSKDSVIRRNAVKSKNMLFLAHMKTTYKNIPYQAYYFSRNLEHALHDIIKDCSDEEKRNYSNEFNEKYKDQPHEFLSFISTEPPAVPCSEYVDSWDFISKAGKLHSLRRGSNLHILLKNLLSMRAN